MKLSEHELIFFFDYLKCLWIDLAVLLFCKSKPKSRSDYDSRWDLLKIDFRCTLNKVR